MSILSWDDFEDDSDSLSFDRDNQLKLGLNVLAEVFSCLGNTQRRRTIFAHFQNRYHQLLSKIGILVDLDKFLYHYINREVSKLFSKSPDDSKFSSLQFFYKIILLVALPILFITTRNFSIQKNLSISA
ncbi:hypothetical protein [Acinetobacter sp. ANC 5414]|uniref:hypothetical protein n=1 Tax=Acinetobacter sp. ANC 5414 TaxID=2731251 RepID=UPI00148F7C43|nr:hypothetical protein [Acinetobacter sp. ANC 5414]NNG99395.1 hypothetical protein [Acinetobacter sp. ANC 5414]